MKKIPLSQLPVGQTGIVQSSGSGFLSQRLFGNGDHSWDFNRGDPFCADG